jgi:ClpP class serine protease
MSEAISDRLVSDLVEAVKEALKKEESERLRDVYLVGDIDKDSARASIQRLRELAADSAKPITMYLNTPGGNVTDGLAIHDVVRQLVAQGHPRACEVGRMAVHHRGRPAPRPPEADAEPDLPNPRGAGR